VKAPPLRALRQDPQYARLIAKDGPSRRFPE
jgi:hypothetical protein